MPVLLMKTDRAFLAVRSKIPPRFPAAQNREKVMSRIRRNITFSRLSTVRRKMQTTHVLHLTAALPT